MAETAESETVVPASPKETWEAITDPGQWLAEDAEVDLRPGGDLVIGDRSGFVEEVVEAERLVYWWGSEGEESSRVEISLSSVVDGTRVRVAETRPLTALVQHLAAGPQLSAIG